MCIIYYICYIYSTVGRSIADIYDLGDIFTVLYILYTMVSAQQTNLLPKNASQNGAIFAQRVCRMCIHNKRYFVLCC